MYQPDKKDHLLPRQNLFEMTMPLLVHTSNMPKSLCLFLSSLVEVSCSILFIFIPEFWLRTEYKSVKAKSSREPRHTGHRHLDQNPRSRGSSKKNSKRKRKSQCGVGEVVGWIKPSHVSVNIGVPSTTIKSHL